MLSVPEVGLDVRTEHLTDEDISGYLDGDASVDERRQVEMHIESCAECRAAIVDVMRAVESAPAQPIPATTRYAVATRRPRWVTGGIGAAAAAGIIAVAFLRSDDPTIPRESQRAPSISAADARPSIAVIGPGENAVLDRARVRFAWHGTGADTYRFLVSTQAGEPVWTHETSDTTLLLPGDVALRRGEMYFWRVDAVTAGISASSVSRAFTIR